MSYRVTWSRQAARQLLKLPKRGRLIILAWVSEHLDGCENPRAVQNGKALVRELNELGSIVYEGTTRAAVEDHIEKVLGTCSAMIVISAVGQDEYEVFLRNAIQLTIERHPEMLEGVEEAIYCVG